MIRTRFQFHPIGQGCFYTGKICLNNSSTEEFKFVFDCGSNSIRSYLDREIADYKARELNGHLNLLILSHFDADHVNGVFNLLGGIKCDRLVIPYYDPIERLLLAIINNDANDDYISMLQNPIDFFSGDRFNIDEIVIVGGPEENDSDQIINPDRIPPKESNGKINDAKSFKFSADYLSGKEKAKRLKYIANSEGFTANLNKVQFLKIPHLVLIDIWEFIFYVKGCKSDAHEEFKNEINSFQTDYSLTMAEMFSVNNLKRIKSIYSTHFGANLNVTSLVTYHGPIFNIDDRCFLYYDHFYHPRLHPNNNKAGTLLTGDVKLKGREKERIIRYFKRYQNSICVFQVPHHGSKHCWDLRSPNGFESFGAYVINHGLGRSHHPSSEVVHYIKKYCRPRSLYLNNEVNRFTYGFHSL